MAGLGAVQAPHRGSVEGGLGGDTHASNLLFIVARCRRHPRSPQRLPPCWVHLPNPSAASGGSAITSRVSPRSRNTAHCARPRERAVGSAPQGRAAILGVAWLEPGTGPESYKLFMELSLLRKYSLRTQSLLRGFSHLASCSDGELQLYALPIALHVQ